MKKIFTIVLASACLWGCVQKSEIDDLQKQIDDLKAGEIATMSAQIAGIQTSLGDLQRVDTELRGLIETLQEDLSAIDGGDDGKYEEVQRELASLASADEALGQRISDLKNYCDQQDNGVRDWVSLTFTTLEQHSAVLNEIAAIKIRLGQLESALTTLDATLSQKISDAEARVASAIEASETSVKGWVNEQLSGYYTIAQADAKLKLLEDAYKAADETLAGDISTLRADLTTAVTNLTSAYQAAISDAITANNGVINAKIASDIQAATSALQTQIDAITTRITNLESRVGALEAAVAKIIGMVQSIVVVPDYSDGSVKLAKVADNELRFEVYPLEAAALIAETGASILSLDYVETLTKSSEEFFNLPITAVDFTGKTLLITVDGTGLPDTIVEGSTTANARLKISDGTNTRSSEYFPIYRSESGSDDGVAKTGESADVGESSAKLYGWSTQDGVAGASVIFGIEYSATDLTTDAITLRADEKDSNNKYCCQATGLSSNTLYYYRAFTLYNGIRTYGEVKTFTTLEITATVTTQEATNVKFASATLNGKLSVDIQDELLKNVGFLVSAMVSDLESLKTSGVRIESSLNEDGSFSATPTDFPVSTTLYYVAWANVYDKVFYGEVVSFTTGNILPAGAVDMGLSVLWASCNLCEDGLCANPEDYGDYYAWGETEPYYSSQDPLTWKDGKTGYNWSSYSLCGGSSRTLTRYNNSGSYGAVDNKTTFSDYDYEDDAARAKLGGKWRLPTDEEWEELSTQCTWTWTTYNGVNGRLVTAPNGNSIFLPAAGYLDDTFFNGAGSYGYYWSSSLNTGSPDGAWAVGFSSGRVGRDCYDRYFGHSVRPVTE